MLLFYLSVIALNCYTMWYDQMYITYPYPSKDYAKFPLQARVLFLTFWCLLTQTIYYAIAVLNIMYGSTDASPRNPPLIRKIKDTAFALSFSVALFVSSSFWAMYYYDKSYLFPDLHTEIMVPKWMNHTLHSMVAVFMIIEFKFSNINYPSRNLGVGVAAAYNFGYLGLVLFSYYVTDAWPYPFLQMFSGLGKTVFFTASAFIGLGIYIVGEQLNRLTNSTSKTSPKKKN